jgi:murein DD-endopeptidase MepM/ murein hydrolase activator NlpD
MAVETFSAGVLLILAIIAFGNLRAGTLGEWLAAKFLNRAAPNPHPRRGAGTSRTGPAPGPGFVHPLPGSTCSSPFGAPRGGGRHGGLDLAAPTGTPVIAAAPGRVTFAGAAGDCGLRVVIDHGGGLETRYCHLSRITTHLGAQPATGEKIGEVGATGNATGPHLHFEVARNGTLIDPAPMIGVTCGSAT